jgi:hypothetical protein
LLILFSPVFPLNSLFIFIVVFSYTFFLFFPFPFVFLSLFHPCSFACSHYDWERSTRGWEWVSSKGSTPTPTLTRESKTKLKRDFFAFLNF